MSNARSKPLRILHVIDQLTGGGAEVSLVEYLSHVGRSDDLTHSLVALNGQPETVAVAKELPIPTTVGSPGRRPALSDASLISTAIAEFRPDVVHCALVRSTLAAARALRGTDIPMLVTLTSVHYDIEDTDGSLKKRWGIRLTHAIHGFALRRKRVWFHAVTRSVGDKAIETFGLDPTRIQVVPRGRPDPRLRVSADRDSLRRDLGIPIDAPVVVSVAREHLIKNPMALLASAEQLQAESNDLTVLFVGGRSTASEAMDERLRGSTLGPNVIRLGYRDDVPNLLAASDVFVSTSRSEGLPGAIVEAIGIGLPVIAFNVSGVPDVLGDDHPGLVPFGDGEGLTLRIREALTNPEVREQISQLDRKLFEDQFEIGRYSVHLHEVYKNVVKAADGTSDATVVEPDLAAQA